MFVIAVLLVFVSVLPMYGQTYESHASDCFETAEHGLWSPWVEFDSSQFRGQWFVAEHPLGGSCSVGGAFFAAGSVMQSGTPLDLRVLGVGDHYLTAKLSSLDNSASTIRKAWHVRVTEPGDINGDGEVTFNDFLWLARTYGSRGREHGDLDYSGTVSFGDFMILSGNFGNTHQSSRNVVSLPEPDPFLAFALGFVFVLGRWR